MEGMGGLEQSSCGTLVCKSPPCKSHAELRWRLAKDFYLGLIEKMPCLGGLSTPLLGEFFRVYILGFSIFVSINGRAKLLIIKF
jgi:hypothetical protein